MRLIIVSIIISLSLFITANAKQSIAGTASVTVANSLFSVNFDGKRDGKEKEKKSQSSIDIGRGVTVNIPAKLEPFNIVTLNGFTRPEIIIKDNAGANLTYSVSIQDTPIFEKDGKRYMLAMQNKSDIISSYGTNDVGYSPIFVLIETDKEFTLIEGKQTPAFLSYNFFS